MSCSKVWRITTCWSSFFGYFSTNLSNLSNDELVFHVKLGKPSAKIIQSKRRTSPLSDPSDLSDPSPGALERFFFFTNWQREIPPKWRNEGTIFYLNSGVFSFSCRIDMVKIMDFLTLVGFKFFKISHGILNLLLLRHPAAGGMGRGPCSDKGSISLQFLFWKV